MSRNTRGSDPYTHLLMKLVKQNDHVQSIHEGPISLGNQSKQPKEGKKALNGSHFQKMGHSFSMRMNQLTKRLP